jgi:SAM-dependent methyltransferase
MSSNSPDIIAYNLLKGIPFKDNSFEVVYHSQVLEHFQKENAPFFIKECYRVLKPGGILRVVTPDLENLARNYLMFLEQNINAQTEESAANYEWILLEMSDQTVRNQSGGNMAKYLQRPIVINEKFIMNRIGLQGKKIRDRHLNNFHGINKKIGVARIIGILNPKKWWKALKIIRFKLLTLLLTKSERKYLQIGKFRLDGEIHYWLYDRYSLFKLLESCGFKEIRIKTPIDSEISNWGMYELDVKNDQVYDPTSLFMEARK